jgi:Cys-rich four helix bundle protein (predicted Tat secretion target)
MNRVDPDQDELKKSQAVAEGSAISRRALLAGTAALAVGVSTSGAMAADLDAHSGDRTDRGSLVRAAGDCGIVGELCQAHCQQMLASGDTRLAACSASVNEMMASCSALMQLAASDSQYLPAMAKLCSEILEDCKAICEKHSKHDVCKACAEACGACLEECKKVMA